MQSQDQAFQTILDHCSDMIAIVDADGVIMHESASVKDHLGFLPEELVGRNISEFIHPEDLERVGRTYAFLAANKGSVVSTDLRFCHKDGSWLELHGTGHNLMDHPSIAGILVTFTDTTPVKRERESFMDSLQEFRFFANNVLDVIWTADVQLQLQYVSPAIERQLGYSVEEALSRGLPGLLTPSSYEAVIKAAAEMWTDQGAGDEDVLELELVHKNGSIVWMETSSRVMRGQDGQPKSLLGVSRDITRRKLAEEELQRYQGTLEEKVKERTLELEAANRSLINEIAERKRAEAALQAAKDYAENLIETANAMVVELDSKGNVRVFNRAAEQITGYTLEEMRGRNWFDVIVPKDRYPEVWQVFAGLRTKTLPKNFENPILTKYGEERYIIWQNNEVMTEGEMGTISFGIDITPRKKAEEKLAALYEREKEWHEHLEELVEERSRQLADTEQRFRQVADNTPDLIASFDREIRHTAVNTAVSKAMGLAPEAILGKDHRDLGFPEPVVQEWQALHRRVLDKGEYVRTVSTTPMPDGKVHVYEIIFNPIRGSDGEIIGSSTIGRDITERRQAEDEMRNLSRRIVRLQEEERASIAHDLHDEIGQLMTYISLQLERARRMPPETVGSVLQDAKRTLTETIQKVRHLSSSLQPPTLDLGLDTALQQLGRKFTTESGIGLELDQSVQRDVPAETKLAIYRIVQESLTNIMRHSEASKARVRVFETGDTIEVIIEDSGVGFDPKRVAASLGLSGMKERALSLGGEFGIDSAPGAGTRITVAIPLPSEESCQTGTR